MELLLLAFALAMDSVALSIASGAKCRALTVSGVIKVSFIFGFFQALMPFLGYFLGLTFVSFIASIDHFVAFGILSFLGIKMILEAREHKDEACLNDLGLKVLTMGAIATSIDALAVGVTFSFENIDIIYTSILIGSICFILCVLACYAGKFLGIVLEKKALILGGVILIGISVKILITHLLDHGFLAHLKPF
ncbi:MULTISPECIES: manganese efflux pump MntP family protein [unclassified Campylobacter]|uniref:manganese efflux pump MntP n=1 Tax=unclassified Campylobacter TaxID=2593542 RepID=UPI0014742699|nr:MULTISPECIES: manganese efflux pump MntP family protein [unclassified Campylobacter]